MPVVNPDAPFRPRRGRAMAIWTGIIATVLSGLIALFLPGPDQGGPWGPVDRAMVWGLGLGIAALMARFAMIGAWPGPGGLRVRNLMLTQVLPWDEIEDVRFGGGEPWVDLELAEGESIAVMAIQRADGDFGVTEAQRLTRLIEERQRG